MTGFVIDADRGHTPRTVLPRIADHPINKIGELLPWNLGISAANATGRLRQCCVSRQCLSKVRVDIFGPKNTLYGVVYIILAAYFLASQ